MQVGELGGLYLVFVFVLFFAATAVVCGWRHRSDPYRMGLTRIGFFSATVPSPMPFLRRPAQSTLWPRHWSPIYRLQLFIVSLTPLCPALFCFVCLLRARRSIKPLCSFSTVTEAMVVCQPAWVSTDIRMLARWTTNRQSSSFWIRSSNISTRWRVVVPFVLF